MHRINQRLKSGAQQKRAARLLGRHGGGEPEPLHSWAQRQRQRQLYFTRSYDVARRGIVCLRRCTRAVTQCFTGGERHSSAAELDPPSANVRLLQTSARPQARWCLCTMCTCKDDPGERMIDARVSKLAAEQKPTSCCADARGLSSSSSAYRSKSAMSLKPRASYNAGERLQYAELGKREAFCVAWHFTPRPAAGQHDASHLCTARALLE